MRRRDEVMYVESINSHLLTDGASDTHLIPEHDEFDVQPYTESIPHNELRDVIIENSKRNMSHFIERHTKG